MFRDPAWICEYCKKQVRGLLLNAGMAKGCCSRVCAENLNSSHPTIVAEGIDKFFSRTGQVDGSVSYNPIMVRLNNA